MEIKKILCPTDFSETSEKAVEYALFLATAHQAQLTLLHVVDHLQGFDHYEILALTPMEIAKKIEKRATESLDDLVNRIKGSVAVDKAVQHGKTSVEICEAAKAAQADLIVIGSHGRTGLSHVLIGSVAETVVRHADCPVLVVRATE
jgi:universal stress protein A